MGRLMDDIYLLGLNNEVVLSQRVEPVLKIVTYRIKTYSKVLDLLRTADSDETC